MGIIKAKRLSLRAHLVGLVVVAVIPVVFFAATLVAFLARQRIETLEVNLKSTTKALGAAVDQQIISVVSSLKILGEVEDFSSTYIPDLHKRLKRFVKNQKDWISISVADANGIQLFNTALPYGSKLPGWGHYTFFQTVVEHGKPVITGYRITSILKLPVVTILVPVKKDDKVVTVIIASLKIESLSKLLFYQDLPHEWVVSMIDGEGRILARSQKAEEFLGTLATEALIYKVAMNDEGMFHHENKEKKLVYGAYQRSKITGWSVALSLPDKTLGMAFWRTVWAVVGGGTLLLAASILLAIYFGRKIANPILALSKVASALGRGEKTQEISTSVKEVYTVSLALKNAAIKRDQSDEEIRSLYAKATEAIEVRDNFLSVASHELKTPLTTLKLQSQYLERKFLTKDTIEVEELKKPFSRISDQVRRLTILVDDLLDVARITSGHMDYHIEKFDLTQLVTEVTMHFEGQAANFGSKISIVDSGPVVGDWDKNRVEQVVTNLISNAIKYGNAKPITITVKKDSQFAYFEVKDLGLGIPTQDLVRIFERFERAVDGRKISGLGLGLWIVKKILEGLNGTIEVHSRFEEGSIFIVKLPL